jgi:ribosomal-protein-alanine N-acetyltransferase
MIRRDMDEVLATEQYGINPWNQDEFYKALRQRNCIGMIAEHKLGPIDAYMVYELHKTSLNILKIAGHPLAWQETIQLLLNKLLSKLSHQRRDHINIVVNERFTPMLQLLKDNGFEATGLKRREFNNADGIKMIFKLKMPQNA